MQRNHNQSIRDRRRFLKNCAATALVSSCAPRLFAQEIQTKRLAVISTVWHFFSHTYHIAGRFLEGYTIEGFHHQPPFQVVRAYVEQKPDSDLSRRAANKHGFEITTTVADALGGASNLDVDAVLLIGEHGDYPDNELGQKLYPRHRLFMEIVDVFRKSGRGVPVFCDKHLSYSHQQGMEMVAAAKELGFGFMAGSSLPVTWRQPEIEPPIGTPFTEGLVTYYAHPEAYGFHALETLQCMLERRSANETGVQAVTALRGKQVWEAEKAGLWSRDLMNAALSRAPSLNIGRPEENCADPVACIVEYVDGTRGVTVSLNGHVANFSFAGRIRNRTYPVSSNFYLPAPPGARFFDPLTYNIEKFFETGKSPYPVERTLLTGGILDYAMHSLLKNGERLETPDLAIHYQTPIDSGYFRGRYTDE